LTIDAGGVNALIGAEHVDRHATAADTRHGHTGDPE
jgi:hypothetical protein